MGLTRKIFGLPFSLSSALSPVKMTDIILLENDTLIADQKEVSGLLNDFYINIAREIGIDSQSQDMANHPSIEAIKEIPLNRAILLLTSNQSTNHWSANP